MSSTYAAFSLGEPSWGYKSFTEPYLDSCGTFKDVVISLLATMAKQERLRKERARTKASFREIALKYGVYGPRVVQKVNTGRPDLRLRKTWVPYTNAMGAVIG